MLSVENIINIGIDLALYQMSNNWLELTQLTLMAANVGTTANQIKTSHQRMWATINLRVMVVILFEW